MAPKFYYPMCFIKKFSNMTHTDATYKRPISGQKTLHRLKVKGWKKIFQANGQEKKAGVAIIISDKIDFK